MTDTTGAEPRRPIFAIFEGGGAKGVAHVGALDAIAANNLEIIGVAGTSAGALAAVLAAIGLEASDIMADDDPDANILARHGVDPVGLLGKAYWREFCYLRSEGRALMRRGLLGAPVAFASALFTAPIVMNAWSRRGHFKTDWIKDFVNQVIRGRLEDIKAQAGLDLDIPDEPTFADLSEDIWPTVVPLKIVVTDVSRGTLEVLDRHHTGAVKVAEAVAASIAIPYVFEPARIPSFRPGLFADGGLVSNLPIWAFVDEKLARERERDGKPPIPVIGFSLHPTAPRSTSTGLPSMFEYFRTLAEASLAGSQATTHRFTEDLTVVSLKTDLPLLAFDADWKTLCAARRQGRDCANSQLGFLLDVKPEKIRTELRAVHDEALVQINKRRRERRQKQIEHLRANLIRPWGRFSLRVVEGVNMQGDADDRLLIDRRGSGSALAFKEKGVRVLRCDPTIDHPSRAFMTKYERALVRSSVRSMICVPIFGDSLQWARDEEQRQDPDGVLCLDSDDQDMTADFADGDLVNLLVDKSSVLFAAVSLEPVDG